jgi:hypothetical protein
MSDFINDINKKIKEAIEWANEHCSFYDLLDHIVEEQTCILKFYFFKFYFIYFNTCVDNHFLFLYEDAYNYAMYFLHTKDWIIFIWDLTLRLAIENTRCNQEANKTSVEVAIFVLD